ncbi:aggrecan 1 [Sarotherodon galilaeus]
MQIQKMADLPADRVAPEPPFTTVGLDVFGPWTIVTRRTRGGCSQNKRWAVLFTCMSTRAVHIELIETMSADSFINALRRLFSIRGPAKFLRSDRGTNFVGACKELGLNSGNKAVGKYLQGKGCVWTFNPPHASHMGGSWERLIGVARRILDAMLLRTEQTRLTHEVLCTFMAEVMAIINARPLVPISTDPDSPAVLTPAMLITQKMSAVSAPLGNFSSGQLFGKQWKHVQHLADTFWKRWKGEYLSTLQSRAKWTVTRPNVKEGDVVLLKDSQASRNEWPMGLIVKTFPSSDKKVRKVEVRTVKDGTVKMFLRPVSEIVVLLSETE